MGKQIEVEFGRHAAPWYRFSVPIDFMPDFVEVTGCDMSEERFVPDTEASARENMRLSIGNIKALADKARCAMHPDYDDPATGVTPEAIGAAIAGGTLESWCDDLRELVASAMDSIRDELDHMEGGL